MAWRLADYVLYGRYCDSDRIGAAVERVRELHEAEGAVLVAYRGPTLFHSLLLASHRVPAVAKRWQRQLVSDPYHAGNVEPPYVTYDPEEHDPGWLIDRLCQAPPFDELREALTDVAACTVRPSASNDDALEPEPASFHLVLVKPGETRPDIADDLHDLSLMINASAPVVVHGNLAAEREVQRAMDSLQRDAAMELALTDLPPLDDRRAVERDLPDEMLKTALRLTGSSIGNIYFDTREAKHLELAAAERNVNELRHIRVKDPKSVVAWVYRRGRPMVINDIRDFLRMHPSGGYRSVAGTGEQPYAELAVPIVQASVPGVGAGAVVGVFNVEKVRPHDHGYYTYRDLAVVRMLAARLSLWRAHQLLVRVSRTLAQLTHRNAAPMAPGELPTGKERSTGVPADAWGAEQVVKKTLSSVYDLTRSQSATVRLLTANKRQLVRFCAFPPARMGDEHATVKVTNAGSINAWVARTGQRCYLPNVLERNATAPYPGLSGYLPARKHTRAELCLPVVVAGRLVGTLNLESRHADGYADSIDLATAVVEQVGLALEQARRAQEQTVFSMTAATAANTHQLLKYVDQIRACDGHRDELDRIAAGISRAIDIAAELPDEAPMSTEQLLRNVIVELNVDHLVEWRNRPAVRLRHAGTEALILRTVFEELFRNAHRAAMKSRLWFAVKFEETIVGNRPYLSVRVHNKVRRPVVEARHDVLYRAPVRKGSGRVHIGAFAAGALMRSIGGDVYVESHRPPHFAVAVDIPVVRPSRKRASD